MKVLYIGRERNDAQAVATALRSIDEVVSVLWASQLEHAAKWIDETRDLAALVIEAPTDGAKCAAVLTHARGLTPPPAIILIVPDGTGPLDSLPPGTDSIRRNQFLHRDLAVVVTRALGRAARANLEHNLAQATAALRDAEQRHRAAVDQLAALETQYEIGMARAAATWDMVDEQLRTAAGEVESARQSQAAAAAEVDRLSQLDADLSAQLAEAAEVRAVLERRLADAERSADAVSSRAEHERLAAAEQLAGRQREFESQIARELDQRHSVEASLAHVISARDDEQKRHALAMTDAARRSRELEEALCHIRQDVQSKTADIDGLTTRETELNSRLEEVNASCQDLERRLAATRAAFEEAATRATRDRLTASKKAAEREAELDSRLHQERTTRAALEQAATDAETALRDAQQRHEAALAAAAAELADLQTTREAIQRQLADATTAIRDAAARETELDAQLQQECTARVTLEQTVADAETALRDAQQRHEAAIADASHELATLQATREAIEQQLADATTAIRDAAARHTTLDVQLRQERTTRAALEQTVAHTETALRDAQQRHEAAIAGASRELTDLQATREAIERQLAAATTAIREAAARETELDAQIQQERAARAALEQTVAHTEIALRDAQQRHEAAIGAASHELAELQATRETIEHQLAAATTEIRDAATRHTELDVQLHQERATRAALEQTVADTEIARRDAQQRHDTAIADASHALAEFQATREAIERQLAQATTAIREAAARETELDAQLQQERTTRATFEQTVAHTETALRDAQQRHETALAAAAADLAEAQATREAIGRQLADATTAIAEAATRETGLDAQLQQERTARTTLAQAVAEAETALRDAQQRHEAAIGAASHELAELQATRETIERQLADATTAIREAAARETELDAQLQQERTARATLEQTVADAETAFRDAQQRHEAALAAAAVELEERQTHFDRESLERAEDRERLTQRLRETKADLDDVCRAYESAAADVDRLTHREAELTLQLTGAHTELVDRQGHFDRQLSLTAAERDRVTQTLRDTEVTLDRAQRDYQSAAADLERLTDRATDLIAQLADVQAAHDTLDRQLADATAAIRDAAARQTTLEAQIQQERASRDDLERVLAETRSAAFERESQLEVQFAQTQLEHESRSAEMEGVHRTLTVERDQLQQSLAALREQSQQLQQAMTANLEQLEASRAESHRLFEQAGVAMFRCTRDGALTDVNRACATLIGRRTLDEPRGIEFAAAVFEDPNVLSWLIERCLTTRTRESIETAWRRQDGSRLFMRLSARPCATDIVEVVAEDLTRVRVLEESRSRAQRMEAVGRLALEVAVTCSTLLNGIQQKGREWLETTGEARSRHEGERLFDEVGRAAGFLRELAACGNEQARTPTRVDLNTLVRDLEPVLKRVAGDDVEVQLRDTSSPLNVEIGTERAERLLVNLASYGRGRMPAGGRLRIELGTSVVDRRFTAKHPNVRLGLHALITVTEVGRPAGSGEGRARAAGRPGVDFGTLQELVSECGGHLWMSVQPTGDMVAKIRLPLSIADDQPLPRAASRSRPYCRSLVSDLARLPLERLTGGNRFR